MIETRFDGAQVGAVTDRLGQACDRDRGSHSGQEPLTVDFESNDQGDDRIGEKRQRPSSRLGSRPGPPIPSIPGDAGQLQSMFRYLIQNAREALPSGSGTMEFSTRCDAGGWGVIVIRDSGFGMTPEVLRRRHRSRFSAPSPTTAVLG